MTTPLDRRRFLGLAGGAALGTLVLGACGDSDSGSDSGSDAGDGGSTSSKGLRKVTGDAGPVEVPASPERVIAAIGSFETDIVAVGIMPVLTTTFAGPWVDLEPSVIKTENIPPTAEEVARAEPDLILGWTWVTSEEVYDDLIQIAPYVGMGESDATAGPGALEDSTEPLKSWDKLFLSVCDAVGKKAEGERLVQELEERIEAIAEKRKDAPPLRVARVEFLEAGVLSYRGQNEDTAELMRRIGLTVVGPDVTNNEASLEELPGIDADVIVVPIGSDGGQADLFADIERNPIWQAVPAVKAGRVHKVDGTLWPGLGYLWANALLDDLERLFV
jgi:iron complex transport system substrate-binding protein